MFVINIDNFINEICDVFIFSFIYKIENFILYIIK